MEPPPTHNLYEHRIQTSSTALPARISEDALKSQQNPGPIPVIKTESSVPGPSSVPSGVPGREQALGAIGGSGDKIRAVSLEQVDPGKIKFTTDLRSIGLKDLPIDENQRTSKELWSLAAKITPGNHKIGGAHRIVRMADHILVLLGEGYAIEIRPERLRIGVWQKAGPTTLEKILNTVRQLLDAYTDTSI